MHLIALILLLLTLPALLISAINYFSMLEVGDGYCGDVISSVDVLIPMRNEELNVSACLVSITNSKSLINFSTLVLNDNSEDKTSEILDLLSSELDFKVLSGKSLPEGWLGKNFALHQLAQHSTGEFLVFIDADVRISEFAIANAIALMKKQSLDFISPYPQQIAITFAERLTQPLLQWSFMSSLLLRIAARSRHPSAVVANGQFFIVTRDAYLAAGGHEKIRGEVLDDIELGRALVRSGFKGGVANGSAVASCRMYHSRREVVAGYKKSLWRAFGKWPSALATALFLFAQSVLPFIFIATGSELFLCAYLVIVVSRVFVALKVKSSIWMSALHPAAVLFFLYILGSSFRSKRRNELSWKGRLI